jgi:hypothetical protein
MRKWLFLRLLSRAINPTPVSRAFTRTSVYRGTATTPPPAAPRAGQGAYELGVRAREMTTHRSVTIRAVPT